MKNVALLENVQVKQSDFVRIKSFYLEVHIRYGLAWLGRRHCASEGSVLLCLPKY